MQYLQAKNEIEIAKRMYRKGIITLGEYFVKIGSVLTAFQLEVTSSNEDMEIDWEACEPYKELVLLIQSQGIV